MKQVVQIEMTPEEAQILLEILEVYLSDLRMEIADTDQMDFREGLKRSVFERAYSTPQRTGLVIILTHHNTPFPYLRKCGNKRKIKLSLDWAQLADLKVSSYLCISGPEPSATSNKKGPFGPL